MKTPPKTTEQSANPIAVRQCSDLSPEIDPTKPLKSTPPKSDADEPLVAQAMRREFQFCQAGDDYARTLGFMRTHGLSVLPVVDEEMRVVGMLHLGRESGSV